MEQKKVRRPLAVRSQRKPKGSGQERRDEIIAAAKQLFMTEGFAKVTTRAIAEKAGLSQTGVYLYFPAKEDIPKIKAAVLVHHGELDTRLAATWPAYDAALKEAKVPHEGYIYAGAVHGFNCDATPERYNKPAADLAWQRTIDWFNKYTRV